MASDKSGSQHSSKALAHAAPSLNTVRSRGERALALPGSMGSFDLENFLDSRAVNFPPRKKLLHDIPHP